MIEAILNGLVLGFVYVLLAIGLSVIFGVMHVINFSHGELLALGAYFAVVITAALGGGTGFLVALIVAPILVGLVGILIERFAIQPLYDRNPLYHILLTFGLVLIINDAIIWRWGATPTQIDIPALLTGPVEIFGFTYARYNLFIIAIGAVAASMGWLLLTRTRIGLIVRAGAQDRERVKHFGINIDNYYSIIFGFGAMLAGLAGVVFGGFQNVNPNMGISIIIIAFVVVIIGGLGSYKGAVVAGLSIGIFQVFVQTYLPAGDGIAIFLLLVGILLIRPEGLYGTELHHPSRESLLHSYEGVLANDTRSKLALVALGLFMLVPFGAGTLYGNYVGSLAITILIWAIFALGLDFLMGFTGMVSLGHALFFGIGSYAVILTVLHVTPYAIVALLVALALCWVIAWVVGYLSIQVTGIYFALITLGFAELYYNLLFELEFTGGDDGLFGARPEYGVPGFTIDFDAIQLALGPYTVTGDMFFFYIALAFLLASYLVLRRILRSPFGRVLRGIRENQQRIEFAGYNLRKYKRRSFVISGIIGGLAGGLYGLRWGFVDPSLAHWLVSGEVLIMVILGGLGTLFGPIIGAGVFLGLEEVLVEHFEQARMILGIIFVLFVLFLPGGVVSFPATFAERIRNTSTGGGKKSNKATGSEND